MKYPSLLGAVLSCFLILSCQKDKPVEPERLGNISFEAPKIGQLSRYILLKGDNYKNDQSFDFSYYPDTLEVEIVDETEDGFLIEERLSPNSISLNGENHVPFADSTINYYLQFDQGMLKVKNVHFRMTSRLFFIQTEFVPGLELEPFESLAVEFKGWKTNLPYNSNVYKAHTEGLELFGKTYEFLNVYIENRPMEEKGSGATHAYSLKEGLVRSSYYSWWTGQGFGWDLLPRLE